MAFSRQLSRSRSLFFSTYWLYGSALLVLLGMLLRERAISLLGLLTLCTAGGAWLWSRYSLDNIEYARTLSTDRVFSGDRLTMHVSIVNRKFLPLAWLEIEDEIGDRLRIVGRNVMPSGVPGLALLRITTAVRWYERVTWTIEVECPARGLHPLGPVSLRSGDLFGFFTRRDSIADKVSVTVYPKIADLDEIGIPARHLFGEQRIQRHIITDPSRTIGIRDYRPEDSIRFVHWKATARTQTLQSRVFEPSTTLQFGVFLNLDTFEKYWEGLDFNRAEGAIVTAATIAIRALDAGHAAGMYANGVAGGSDQPLRVRPGRSRNQDEEILTGLAKLSPIASLNFPAILRAETSRFPIGSTIVVVTAMMSSGLAAILDELVREGHHVVVVTIDEVDVPPIRRVTTVEVPLDKLLPYIPAHHHYAVRMSNIPVGPNGSTED